jgi:hypothetical protein
MATISLILLIAAFVVFLLASWPLPSRINLIAAGLALATLSVILGGLKL